MAGDGPESVRVPLQLQAAPGRPAAQCPPMRQMSDADCSVVLRTGSASYPSIVTTVRRPALGAFEQWLCYHLSVGFQHVFVFFDEPGDPGLEVAARFPASLVTVYTRSAALEARWRKQSLFPRFGPWRDSEVMARQMLNAQVAIEALRGAEIAGADGAAAEGIARWVLHIDADELLAAAVPAGVGAGAPSRFAAQPHFDALTRRGFRQAVYLNMEGVPGRTLSSLPDPPRLLPRRHLRHLISRPRRAAREGAGGQRLTLRQHHALQTQHRDPPPPPPPPRDPKRPLPSVADSV